MDKDLLKIFDSCARGGYEEVIMKAKRFFGVVICLLVALSALPMAQALIILKRRSPM